MSAEEVMDEVRKDLPYYQKSGGGVTLSGGEPTVQADFLQEILQGCRCEGIPTAMETTGCAEWEVMQRILPLVDLLLYDIKHMNPERHARLTGRDNRLILRNLARAVQADRLPIVVHVPLVPGCNDDRANLEALLDHLESLGLGKVGILPFHKLGLHEYEELGISCALEDRPVPGPDAVREVEEHIRSRGFEVVHW
jgi:pyruvate formate lyase activating enzyme